MMMIIRMIKRVSGETESKIKLIFKDKKTKNKLTRLHLISNFKMQTIIKLSLILTKCQKLDSSRCASMNRLMIHIYIYTCIIAKKSKPRDFLENFISDIGGILTFTY